MVVRHGKTGWSLVVAATGLALMAGAAALVASPSQALAAAPTVNYTAVYGAPITVVSSKHHKLSINTSVSQSATGTNLYVSVGLPNHREGHTWTFPLPNSALSLNAGGSGTAKATSVQLGGFGTVSLNVAAFGTPKQITCQSQVVSATRRATISGKFLFDTKSGWGKVGSATRKVTFAKTSDVYWGYDNTATCPTSPPTCTAYTSWSMSMSTASSYVSMSGSAVGKTTLVSGYRSVHLAKPVGASRTDFVTQSGVKPPQLTVRADNSAAMKVFAGKGSATLSTPAPGSSFSEPCGTGTQHLSHTYWSGGKIHQNSPPAKLAAQVYGAIEVPNTGGGTMARTKVTN